MAAVPRKSISAASLESGDKLLLAHQGRSEYAIVLGQRASPSERWAARQLQHFFGRISGASLPIRTDAEEAPARMILVGASRHLEALAAGLDWEALGDEGFALRTAGPHLVLAGGRQRGSMYAVFAFLEEKLGCRWYTAGASRILAQPTIALDSFAQIQHPAFEYREPFFTEAFDADWCARNRCNSSAARLDDQRGDKVTYYPFVHSFDQLIPRSLFAEHPEYFPLIEGRRVDGYVQRCLSNPEVLELAKEQVLRWIEEHPEAQLYSVSQNDTGNWCTCSRCQAVAEEEGSQSGLYLRFANAIAEEVGKRHPRKLIDTLAYQFTEQPPRRTRPRPNVRVRLCPIACCQAHPYEQCAAEPNRAFVRNLREWARIADTLYIWHYNINFSHYLLPFPDFRELEADTRLYRRSGVKGIFFEGGYAPGGGSDWAELRSYVLAKLLWNPDCQVDPLVDEFLAGVYGEACQPLRAYFDLLHEQVADPEQHFFIYSGPSGGYLSAAVLAQAGRLFDEAEQRVRGDAELEARVRKARMPVRYAQLMQQLPAFAIQGEVYAPGSGAEGFRTFMEDVRRCGIQQLREGQPLEGWEKGMEARFKSYQIRRLESDMLAVEVVPELGGRLLGLIDRGAGKNLLRLAGPVEAGYPKAGGYEEYARGDYRSPGWSEPYQVIAADQRKLVLEAQLADGLLLRRTLELRKGGELAIASQLENRGEQSLPVRLRVHPEFAFAGGAGARVEARTASGPWRQVEISGGEAFERYLRGDELPAGEWRIDNAALGWRLVNRFAADQVEVCYINADAGQGRLNLELWAVARELAPGEKYRFEHSYRVSKAGEDR